MQEPSASLTQLSYLTLFLRAFAVEVPGALPELFRAFLTAYGLTEVPAAGTKIPWEDLEGYPDSRGLVESWLNRYNLRLGQKSALDGSYLVWWALFNMAVMEGAKRKGTAFRPADYVGWELRDEARRVLALSVTPPPPLVADPWETRQEFLERANAFFIRSANAAARARLASPPTQRRDYHYRWAALFQCAEKSVLEVARTWDDRAEPPSRPTEYRVRKSIYRTLPLCGIDRRESRRGRKHKRPE